MVKGNILYSVPINSFINNDNIIIYYELKMVSKKTNSKTGKKQTISKKWK